MAGRFTLANVSSSIYNVDPKSFESDKCEFMKKSQEFLSPSKRLVFVMLLTTVYPFMGKFLKMSFSRQGATEFFTEIMKQAIKYREESNFKRADYLEHLTALRKQKDISGENMFD